MELFTKLLALLKPKAVVIPSTPLYSDEEFLEFVAAQARNRSRSEQLTNTGLAPTAALLNKAARPVGGFAG